MRIRPDKDDIEKVARLLLEAKNPLLSVGDEVAWCRAGKEVVELAELLGLPVTGQAGMSALGFWSKPFPTRHPLYVGRQLRDMRYPGKPDVLLNLGNRHGERAAPGTTLISIRLDPTSLARVAPVDLGMVADLRLATADLVAAIRGMATAARLKEIAEERTARTRAHTTEMYEFRQKIARENADRTPVSLERIALELEGTLDKDTCYVFDVDFGQEHGPAAVIRRQRQAVLLDRTERARLGHGGGIRRQARAAGPAGGGGGRRRQLLFQRPAAALDPGALPGAGLNIVLNNHSYNNERNRIWHYGGRQFKTGRDMTCYLGSPDVDYAKASEAFGVEGVVVKEPGELKGALDRGKRAIAEGRPYLLDVHTYRDGVGAASTWHPPYSVADLRQRKV